MLLAVLVSSDRTSTQARKYALTGDKFYQLQFTSHACHTSWRRSGGCCMEYVFSSALFSEGLCIAQPSSTDTSFICVIPLRGTAQHSTALRAYCSTRFPAALASAVLGSLLQGASSGTRITKAVPRVCSIACKIRRGCLQPAYLDTNGIPTSSWHSLTAAWSSVSSGSCLPPGSAMSPLHLSLYARRKIRDVRKSLYPVHSTIHYLDSYFGPGSTSYVRQSVSYTDFSMNDMLFMRFVRNTK